MIKHLKLINLKKNKDGVSSGTRKSPWFPLRREGEVTDAVVGNDRGHFVIVPPDLCLMTVDVQQFARLHGFAK